MAGHGRIDGRVDQLLHLGRQILAHVLTSLGDLVYTRSAGRNAALDGRGGRPLASRETLPGGPPMDYADYQHLLFDRRPNGVVLITINRPEVMNATNARLHWELTQVWLTIDADPAARVALVTGAGRAFSAGGAISLVAEIPQKCGAGVHTLRGVTRLALNRVTSRNAED